MAAWPAWALSASSGGDGSVVPWRCCCGSQLHHRPSAFPPGAAVQSGCGLWVLPLPGCHLPLRHRFRWSSSNSTSSSIRTLVSIVTLSCTGTWPTARWQGSRSSMHCLSSCSSSSSQAGHGGPEHSQCSPGHCSALDGVEHPLYWAH